VLYFYKNFACNYPGKFANFISIKQYLVSLFSFCVTASIKSANLFSPIFYHYQGVSFHYSFYVATNAYSPYLFKKAMEKIKEKDTSTYHYIKDNEPLKH